MKNEIGNPKFPIWLLGDSEPKNWDKLLDSPFDSRHPAVHNIWTPIIANIQDALFKKSLMRIDEKSFYIRNAIKGRSDKPGYKDEKWSSLNTYLNNYRSLITENNPKIIFTFGSFSFEFARRVMNEGNFKNWSYWNTTLLGTEFVKRIDSADLNKTNIIPLLHASIARGYFLLGHSKFTGKDDGNYFDFTSEKIAKLFDNEIFLKQICLS